MNVPQENLYTQSDEWLLREADGLITIGITDYAQHELGELVYVELPEVGSTLAPGDACGVVESVKAVGELFAPVAGEVVETNAATVDDPTIINDSPYNQGWLLKIRLEEGADLSELMDAKAYTEYRSS